jgi:hypothetical protein
MRRNSRRLERQSGKPYRLHSGMGYHVILPDSSDSLEVCCAAPTYYLQEEKEAAQVRAQRNGWVAARPVQAESDLAVLEIGLALFRKGRHAFLLIFGGEG